MKLHLFLVQYTELCLCYAGLFLGQAARSSAATESARMERSGRTIWPRHSSSYISGRHLQDSWAAVGGGYLERRDAFLTDAVLIHLFFSPMTNGLISQLSHWHAILQFLLGIPPHRSLSLKKGICPTFPTFILTKKEYNKKIQMSIQIQSPKDKMIERS